jgi:hypothetical protein
VPNNFVIFCITHFNGFPITVPSDTESLLYRQRLLEKEVAYPLTLFFNSAVRFSTELTLEDIPTQKSCSKFDLSYMRAA